MVSVVLVVLVVPVVPVVYELCLVALCGAQFVLALALALAH